MRPSSTLSLAALCAGLAATPLAAQNVFTLDELVFSASLTDIARDRTGVRVSQLSSTDMVRSGRLQFSEFLESLPGISMTQNGPIGNTTQIRIRGLDWTYIPVRINGIDVTDPSAVQNRFDFGRMTSSGVASAEVLYGAQSAILGSGAIAGAINITTVEAPETLDTEIGYNFELGSYQTARAGFTYATRFERGFIATSLGHTTSEGFSSADENAGFTEKDGFDGTDFSFTGEFQATDTTTIGATILSQQANYEFDEYSSSRLSYDGPRYQDFELLAGRIFSRFNLGTVQHELGVEASITTRNDPTASVGSGYYNLFEGQREKVTYQGSYNFSQRHSLTFGAEAMTEKYFSTDNSTPISKDYDTNSIFGEWLAEPLQNLNISVSTRYTDNSAFGDKSTGRIAAAWQMTAETTLRLSYSTGFRTPSLNELYGPFGSNPALRPETSQSAEVGIEHQYGRLTFQAGLFQTRITDIIKYVSGSGYNQIPGTSRSNGYELGLTYVYHNDAQIDVNLTSTEAHDANGIRLDRVPRRDISVTASAPLSQNTRGSLVIQSLSDRLDRGPLEDFTAVNANISHDLANGAQLFLRIDNLFDEEYQTARSYGTSDRAFYIGVRGTF